MWHICVLYPVWFAAYLFHFAFANAVQQCKKSCENNKQIWKNLKCFTFQLKCLQMRSCFYKAGQYLIYAICKSDTSAASARRTSKSWSKLQTLKTAITTSEDTHSTQMLWCLQVLCKPLEILTQNFMKNSKLNLFLFFSNLKTNPSAIEVDQIFAAIHDEWCLLGNLCWIPATGLNLKC